MHLKYILCSCSLVSQGGSIVNNHFSSASVSSRMWWWIFWDWLEQEGQRMSGPKQSAWDLSRIFSYKYLLKPEGGFLLGPGASANMEGFFDAYLYGDWNLASTVSWWFISMDETPRERKSHCTELWKYLGEAGGEPPRQASAWECLLVIFPWIQGCTWEHPN